MHENGSADRIADRYELRWIRDETERYWGDPVDDVRHQLESLEEILGACQGCIGLGRRIAIEIGTRRTRDPVTTWRHGTCVMRLDPHARTGVDTARGWIAALFQLLEHTAGTTERHIIKALKKALLAERPGTGRKPTAKQRKDWIECTFEAFVEDEGWKCGGGDVHRTTRTVSAGDDGGARPNKYPVGETRKTTGWLWHEFRAMLEWKSDGIELIGEPQTFKQATTRRDAHQAREARARREFARLSARSIANATTAKLALCAVMNYDEDGPGADVLEIGSERAQIWAREDDGKPPEIDGAWLKAQALEAMTGAFRDVLGFGMHHGIMAVERRQDGTDECVEVNWVPAEGVDGQGDPTYGNLAVPIVEWIREHALLGVGTADDAARALGVAIAEGVRARTRSSKETVTVYWYVPDNRFATSIEPAERLRSATEIVSGERTGRIRRRTLNAARAHAARRERTGKTGPVGAGA